MTIFPSQKLLEDLVLSETNYVEDRMKAIHEREGNPEGVEIRRFGNALCTYSRTMPWPAFNSVKGLQSNDLSYLDEIIEFYRSKDRKPTIEIVPGFVDQSMMLALTERGFAQTGFHTTLYKELSSREDELGEAQQKHLEIRKMNADEIVDYARIHCRSFGLTDDGIVPVARNNEVLLSRQGWGFYLALVNGQPAGAGAMYVTNRTASLTFAAVLPEYRNQGLHSRLLLHRMAEASSKECSLIIGQCSFGSQSHRNMERSGMKIGYVRSTWTMR